MFVIHAATPEIMRDVIVGYLDNQAAGLQRDVASARTQRDRFAAERALRAIESAARLIRNVKVETGA